MKMTIKELYEQVRDGRYFTDDELTVDHIEPWSKGGRTVLSNAQILCRPCNSKKQYQNNYLFSPRRARRDTKVF